MFKKGEIILGLTLFVLFVAFLQTNYCYHFYYMEQIQLFLFNAQWAEDILLQPGGVSLWLSRFMVQFFVVPWAGSIIISILLYGVWWSTKKGISGSSKSMQTSLLSLFPVVSLYPVIIDPNYFLQGIIAYLFFILFFVGYRSFSDSWGRHLTGLFIGSVLYLIAGPVSILFAVCVLLWEFVTKGIRWYISLVLLAVVLLLALASLYFSAVGEFRFAFLPDAYADPQIDGSKGYLAWIVFPFCILASHYYNNRIPKTANRKRKYSTLLIPILLLAGLFAGCYSRYGLTGTIQEKQLDYYAYTKQWNKLLAVELKDPMLERKMNLVNYALAQQGKLGDAMFAYNQQGVKSLVSTWDNSITTAMPMSDIYYGIGDVASAQKFAFEGCVSSVNGGSSRLLKRLVETNLIMGAYRVAEKYIALLEQTLFYKEWASGYRQLLFNDEAVEKHPVLGSRRKGLDGIAGKAVSAHLLQELEMLAVNNPKNQTAIQYLAAFYLVNKDLSRFKLLLEKYYATDVWPQLAVTQQQALPFIAPDDRKYWIQHGMSSETEHQYTLFERELVAQDGSSAIQKRLAEKYGDTYWYYLLFK